MIKKRGIALILCLCLFVVTSFSATAQIGGENRNNAVITAPAADSDTQEGFELGHGKGDSLAAVI